jgi:hypothetical protein
MNLQGWEWLVWGAAVFIAVTSLVKLMRSKRDDVYRELLTQAEAEQAAQQAAEQRLEQEKKRKAKVGAK